MRTTVGNLNVRVYGVNGRVNVGAGRVIATVVRNGGTVRSRVYRYYYRAGRGVAGVNCRGRLSIYGRAGALIGATGRGALTLHSTNATGAGTVVDGLSTVRGRTLLSGVSALQREGDALIGRLSRRRRGTCFTRISTRAVTPIGTTLNSLDTHLTGVRYGRPRITGIPCDPIIKVPAYITTRCNLKCNFNFKTNGNF